MIIAQYVANHWAVRLLHHCDGLAATAIGSIHTVVMQQRTAQILLNYTVQATWPQCV